MSEEKDRHLLHEEIAHYATEVARTGDDLDERLEAAGIQHLNDIE